MVPFLALVGIVMAMIAMMKGSFPLFQIGNRKSAVIVLVISVIVLVLSVPTDDGERVELAQQASAGVQPQKSQVKNQKEFLEPGEVAMLGIWGITVSDEIIFSKELGSVFLSIKADEGYSFAQIPVAVWNTSNKTDSLVFATWKLFDDRGYEYEIESLADMYLGGNARLDVSQVPPDAVRGGYLVFQVKDAPGELHLELRTTRGNAKWKIR